MVKTTAAQIIKIDTLLKAHYKTDGEHRDYETGWDDARIAQEVSTLENPLNENHVGKLRRELFGNFVRAQKNPQEARVAILENEVRYLKERLLNLASLHDKLVQNLSLNRIADVKHLVSSSPAVLNGPPPAAR